MKKKTLLMLVGTLVIGIVIGAVGMSIFTSKKWKSYSEPITKERFTQKIIRIIEPNEEQLAKIKSIIEQHGERASSISKENSERIVENLESLYRELTPFLNETQKQKFENKINRIKQKFGL